MINFDNSLPFRKVTYYNTITLLHQLSYSHTSLLATPPVSAPSEPVELPAPAEQAGSASRPAPAFPTYRECRWPHARALCGSVGHRYHDDATPDRCGNKPASATDTAHCSGTGTQACAISSIPPLRHRW